MPQFHEAVGGQRFLQGQLPNIIQSLNTISSALQEQNEIAVRTNLITIEANELKKRELDLLERKLNENSDKEI